MDIHRVFPDHGVFKPQCYSARDTLLPRRLAFGVGYIVGRALRFWIYLLKFFPLIAAWQAVGGFSMFPHAGIC